MSIATPTDADARVRDAVIEQLEWDPRVNASAIGVTASGGTVTLTGFIDNCAGKLAAERAAQRAGGVRAVANDIEVRLERTDADIAADVTRTLEVSKDIPSRVQAAVHNGRVTLTGTVDSLCQKSNAEHAVRQIRGVHRVADYIRVAPRAAADAADAERVDHRVEPPDEIC